MAKKAMSHNLNVRLTDEELDFIRGYAEKLNMKQGDLIREWMNTERPFRSEFVACVKVLSFVYNQGFIPFDDIPLLIQYLNRIIDNYSALPITKADIDLPSLK